MGSARIFFFNFITGRWVIFCFQVTFCIRFLLNWRGKPKEFHKAAMGGLIDQFVFFETFHLFILTLLKNYFR